MCSEIVFATEIGESKFSWWPSGNVLPAHANDFEALRYAREHDLFWIACNRDDSLALAADHPNPGMIILVPRRSRHVERGHLLAPAWQAGVLRSPGRTVGCRDTLFHGTEVWARLQSRARAHR